MLLVDIGNSLVKWRFQTASGISAQGSSDTQGTLSSVFDYRWRALPKPCRILVSNVAAKLVADRLTEWVTATWGVAVELAYVSAQACGVRNGYHDPKQLGIDRWLALIAAWSRYRAAACVVDCGTAVTIDGLSMDGRHTGGLILPGVSLMHRCLAANTVALEQPHSGRLTPMARNTQDAIWCGGVYAIAACIDRVAGELDAAFGECQVVITGGNADLVATLLQRHFEAVPGLVLDGLAVWGETHQ